RLIGWMQLSVLRKCRHSGVIRFPPLNVSAQLLVSDCLNVIAAEILHPELHHPSYLPQHVVRRAALLVLQLTESDVFRDHLFEFAAAKRQSVLLSELKRMTQP